MNESRFEDLPEEEQEWIDACLDGTIDEESFAELQERMLMRPELRRVMRRSMGLHHDLQEQAEGAADSASEPWMAQEPQPENIVSLPITSGRPGGFPVAIAAGLAFLFGLAIMHFGRPKVSVEHVAAAVEPQSPPETEAEGFAVMQNLFDAEWAADQAEFREGDSLGAEVFRLKTGVAEIQFFSGATMVVQGPAEISLKSAWEANCREGVVRMRVPPAARGFKLHGPETEIIDLGTEFGLEVRNGKAHVEVIDGEISFRHRNGKERIVKKGAAWRLPSGDAATPEAIGRVDFPDAGNFDSLARNRRRTDYERWVAHRNALARDDRVIAYYTFDRPQKSALIASLAEPRNPELDGAVVLAETTAGRWPGMKQALEFRRPGSRVRVRIPGEFSAFTFAAWVRIDSLDRRYNALFMGDGYETGEPHWQIRDDGKLMLSVMVDDQRPNPNMPSDAGFHRVYFSSPIWDKSMSGQWMHLASIFDPATRQVSHFVNGKRISRQQISADYLIETLRIGNGEIGNWGQPFRETPWFAIRNLNGRIDELVILKAALTDPEIIKLYEQSRAKHR